MSALAWYYVLSGLITMIMTHIFYDKLVKEIPLMEMIPKEVLIPIQFFTGFFQLPIVFLLSLSILKNHIIIGRQEREIKKQEARNKELKAIWAEHERLTIILRDVYEKYIEIKKDMPDDHKFSSLLVKKEVTVRQIKDSILWMYDEKFRRMSEWDSYYYIVVKDNQYAPTNQLRVESLTDDGWEILFAYKNIFFNHTN